MTKMGAWIMGSIPICLKPCKNKDKKCKDCFKFSNFKEDKNVDRSNNI